MSCYFFTYYFLKESSCSLPLLSPPVALFYSVSFWRRPVSTAQADFYLLGTSIHPHLPKLGLQVSVDHCAHLSPHFKSLPLVLFVEEEGEGGPEGGGGAHVHSSHSRSC